jgi:PAS domain S-box-containing protein
MPKESKGKLFRENEELRQRLDEALQVVHGIQRGEVDALVVSVPEGEKVYTLTGADQAYRIAVEAASEGALTLMADGTILYCNACFAEIVKTPLEKIPTRAFHQFVEPGDRRRLTELLEGGRGKKLKGEFRLQAADGTEVPAQLSLVPLELGGEQALCVVVTDLTEVVRAREARLRLSCIVESSFDAIASTTLDGTILTWNAAAERMFGYTGAEAIGQPIPMLLPADRAGEQSLIRNAVGQGNLPLHLETVRVSKDGKRIDVKVSVSPIHDTGGRTIGISCVYEDITARRQAESMFRGLLEAGPDATVVSDWNGKVILVNAQFERMFGWTREELLGKNIETFVPRRFHESHAQQQKGFLAMAKARPMRGSEELYALRKDGTEFPADISLSPVTTTEGIMVCCAVRDITQRKKTEDSLRQLSRLLLRLQDEERRQVARDLQDSMSPLLISLVGKLYALRKRALDLDAVSLRLLEEGLTLAEHASTVTRGVSSLLHPPMLESHGLPASLRWYLESYSKRHGFRVETDLPSSLPPLPKGAEIALFRIVQDSLTRVLRHSGNGVLRVRIYTVRQDLTLQIVNEESQFLPNVPGTDEEAEELAIPIMQQRLAQLGGQLDIRSDDGKTIITASLPLNGHK